MSLRGDALGADLYRLLVVANRDLPSISEIYHVCLSQADQVTPHIDAVMHRPDFFGTGDYGPVREPWVVLHGLLRWFLAQTAANLSDTAAVLKMAVDAYRATDDRAAAKLRALCAADGYPVPDRVKAMP